MRQFLPTPNRDYHFKIAPSLMCADLLELKQDLDLFVAESVDYLHNDIMDGYYAPLPWREARSESSELIVRDPWFEAPGRELIRILPVGCASPWLRKPSCAPAGGPLLDGQAGQEGREPRDVGG